MTRDELLEAFARQQRELGRLHAQCEAPSVLDLELTMQQLRALALVGHDSGLTAQDLAARLAVSPATVSGLVRRLEDRGLVARTASRADRRSKEIHLTAEGTDFLLRLDAAGTEMWASVVDELTDDEMEDLVRLTDRIVGILDARVARAQATREAG